MYFPEYANPPAHVSLTPYSPLHFKHLDLDDGYLREVSKVISPEDMAAYQSQIGMAYTALLYGKPVAVFGAIQLWPGVEEIWSMMGEESRNHARPLTRIAKKFTDFRMISGHLHRLQMNVRCDDTRAVRWAHALGFEIEGTMQKYGTDGSDFYMMSKV